MATIIQTGPDSFIVGDPGEPGDGEHRCGYCGGSGLEYGFDDELGICLSCNGSGVEKCTDRECLEHGDLVPQGPTEPTPDEEYALHEAWMAAEDRAFSDLASGGEYWPALCAAKRASRAAAAARSAAGAAMRVGGFAGQRFHPRGA